MCVQVSTQGCLHVCGGQRSVDLCVSSQELSTLCFQIGSLISLELAKQTELTAMPQGSLVSVTQSQGYRLHYTMPVSSLSYFYEYWESNSDPCSHTQ